MEKSIKICEISFIILRGTFNLILNIKQIYSGDMIFLLYLQNI